MVAVRARIRKWGSSAAAVIPPEVLRKERLAVGDEVVLEVRKPRSLADYYGVLRKRPLHAQRAKDAMRREENE